MSEVMIPQQERESLGDVECEMRGLRLHIDHRSNVATVAETLFSASEAGYNTVIVDAFFDAATAFSSPAMRQQGMTSQHPSLRRSDVLDVVCREARELDLSVYANIDLNIKHPRGARTWLHLITQRSLAPARTTAGLHFCPARPEVRRLLGDVVANVTESYPVDGLLISLPDSALGACNCSPCNHAKSGDATEDYCAGILLQFCSNLKARARKGHRFMNVGLQLNLPHPFVMPGALAQVLEEEVISTFVWCVEDELFDKADVAIPLVDSPHLNVFAMRLEKIAGVNPSLLKALRETGAGIIDTTSDVTPEVCSPLFAHEAMPIESAPVLAAILELLNASVECSDDLVMRSALLARVDALRIKNLDITMSGAVYDEIAVLADSLRNGPPDAAIRIRRRLLKANRLLMLAAS